MRTRLSQLFERSPLALNLCAMSAAFIAYFCMYAFRKPFAAGTYEGLSFLGTEVDLKTAFVICQIFGYALSKYLGIKFCPEVTRKNRAALLVALIVAAELSLVLFAVVPEQLKVAAIFLNGLSLGMVWGLVVWYLEGRQTSEILLAVLSCSFIVSSGMVKDVGRFLLRGFAPSEGTFMWSLRPVPEFWMPAATGCLFLLPLLAAVWLLNQIPEPTPLDRQLRSIRKTMSVEDRLRFVKRYFSGLAMLVIAYVLFTAFRDFRDNYTVEVLNELGYEKSVGTISSMETIIAFLSARRHGTGLFYQRQPASHVRHFHHRGCRITHGRRRHSASTTRNDQWILVDVGRWTRVVPGIRSLQLRVIRPTNGVNPCNRYSSVCDLRS